MYCPPNCLYFWYSDANFTETMMVGMKSTRDNNKLSQNPFYKRQNEVKRNVQTDRYWTWELRNSPTVRWFYRRWQWVWSLKPRSSVRIVRTLPWWHRLRGPSSCPPGWAPCFQILEPPEKRNAFVTFKQKSSDQVIQAATSKNVLNFHYSIVIFMYVFEYLLQNFRPLSPQNFLRFSNFTQQLVYRLRETTRVHLQVNIQLLRYILKKQYHSNLTIKRRLEEY